MTEIQAKQIADLRDKLASAEGQVAHWREYSTPGKSRPRFSGAMRSRMTATLNDDIARAFKEGKSIERIVYLYCLPRDEVESILREYVRPGGNDG